MKIDEVLCSDNGMLIRWTSDILGYGEYFLRVQDGKIIGEDGVSREFLRVLLNLLVDEVG